MIQCGDCDRGHCGDPCECFCHRFDALRAQLATEREAREAAERELDALRVRLASERGAREAAERDYEVARRELYAQAKVADERAGKAERRLELIGNAILDEVETVCVRQTGAPGSVMRRAWELGKRLAVAERERDALSTSLDEAANLYTAAECHASPCRPRSREGEEQVSECRLQSDPPPKPDPAASQPPAGERGGVASPLARPGDPGWVERCKFENPSRMCVVCGGRLRPEQRLTCSHDCAEEEYGRK